MQQFKPAILSTKSLNEQLINDAETKGVSIDALPFIKTETISSIETQQGIKSALLKSSSIIFTSVNAVEAIALEISKQNPERVTIG